MSVLLEKAIEKARELPEPDQDIAAAEIKFLRGTDREMRRRVGPWRIMFDVRADTRIVVIHDVERRGSNTY